MRQNHRGQTLVLFILLLPILILVLGFLVDMGNLHIQKRKINYMIQNTLEYGIQNIDSKTVEQEMEHLLQMNLKPTNYEIEIEEKKITITVTKQIPHILPFLYKEQETEMTIQKSKKEVSYGRQTS